MVENHLRHFLKASNDQGWFVDLDGPVARRFALLFTIKNELHGIREQIMQLRTLEAGKDRPSDTLAPEELMSIRQALWYSVVVRYFKLYANASNTPGYPTLSSRDHLKGGSEELLRFHDALKEIRDKHLSHGIHYESQQMLARVFFEVDPEDGGLMFRPGVIGIKQFSCSTDDLDKFVSLVDLVLTNLQPMLGKANDAVVKEVEKIAHYDEAVQVLESLYQESLALDVYKDEMVKYLLLHHFGLPINRKTEKRLTRVKNEVPNHETIWLDYYSDQRQMVLDFNFLAAGNGRTTIPQLVTKSPIAIPKFSSDRCVHVVTVAS
ncbi:MAG: hypothetical protein EOP84_03065 [Verrucomicrobiaceae bacterium]|nr:MAG: hypothetical protein EOP84_03065 [Verrucomicrobiaceae bacterium]